MTLSDRVRLVFTLLVCSAALASADILVVSASANSIFRYDQTTGAFLQKFDESSVTYPYGLGFGSDGFLYTATSNASNDTGSQIDRYDPANGKLLGSFGALPQTRGMAIGPDGLIYVSAYIANQIWRYNPITSAFVDTVATVETPYSFALDAADNLYVRNQSGTIYKFDASTHAMSIFISDPSLISFDNEAIAFGPDGFLYVGTSPFSVYANQVRRYNGQTGAFDRVFAENSHIDEATSIAFGPDRRIYVGTFSGNVLRLDGATGAFIDVFVPNGTGGLQQNITGLCFFTAGPTGGTITVTSNLPAATFTINGPATYTGSGMSFTQSNAAPGMYTITFDAVSGYATPSPQTLTLSADDTISFFGTYTALPTTGTVSVTTNLPAATFSINGPSSYSGSGTSFSQANALPGSYTITFGHEPGYSSPPSQTRNLAAGGTITFTGVYLPTSLLGGSGSTNQSFNVAEPVNSATGNYYSTHTDLRVAGRGLSVAIVRSYNSSDSYSGPLGAGWTHSYNIFLKQVTGSVVIKEADGHEDTFTDSGGGYTPQTPGVFDSLRGNTDGSFTLTRRNQVTLTFSPTGVLTAISDRNGNTQTLTYSGANLTSLTDTSGRVFSFSYDSNHRLVAISDALGRTLNYSYDGSGNLVSYRDAVGGTTQYSYDANHRMTSAADPQSNVYMQNTYDALGRVIEQRNARGDATTFAYDTPAAGTTTVTDPLGNASQYVHDSSLRLTQLIDPLGGQSAFTYSDSNLKLSARDPLGRVQKFSYDAAGNLTSATDASGKTTQLAYSATNNLTQITDRLGHTTQFTYDGHGNLTGSVDPLGNTTSYSYDGHGQVTNIKNPRGFSTSLSYDAAGNLATVTDALGGTLSMSYDAAGRLISATNQLGKTSTRLYDADDRLIATADPLGNTTKLSYDGNGNLLRLTDANGQVTSYAYGPTNRLVLVTDALGGKTAYSYDGNLNLLSVTDANKHTTTYAYDALSRLITVTDPLARAKHRRYDAAGNMTTAVDASGKSNTFAYDSLNRLSSIALSDGSSVAYSYDAEGNRLTMTDWRGTSKYTYDARNRVTAISSPDGSSVGYGYDSGGNRSLLTYPDGRSVEFRYDGAGRPSGVTDWASNATSYGYDAAGDLTMTTLPNGTSSLYGYDTDSRLVSVMNLAGLLPLSEFKYTLDKVGNRLSVSSASGSSQYTYDALYRLTSWPGGMVRGLGTTTATYDGVGNRLSLQTGFGTTDYTYDAADELLTAGSTAFSYDANGNQLIKTTPLSVVNYTWDGLNRLTSVIGGFYNTRYQYDGDGNRVSQQTPAGTYRYVNDAATPLPVVLTENGPDGAINYVWGQSLISAVSPGFNSFYQFDGLGSVVDITDQTGGRTAAYSYDAWGEQVGFPELEPAPRGNLAHAPMLRPRFGTKNKYGFAGEEMDPNSTLLFLRARYYDSSLGRFISQDGFPVTPGFPVTNNRYQYARLDPVRSIDPSGLSAIDASGAAFSQNFSADLLSRLPGVADVSSSGLADLLEHNPAYALKNANAFKGLTYVGIAGSLLTVASDFSDPTIDLQTKIAKSGTEVGLSYIPYVNAAYALGELYYPNQTNAIVDASVSGGTIRVPGFNQNVTIPGTADFVRDVILGFPTNTKAVFSLVF